MSRSSSDCGELTFFAGDYMSLELQAANALHHMFLIEVHRWISSAGLLANASRATSRMNCSCLSVGRVPEEKKEDEICTSSFSSSTIPLTSGIEEAPQLLLSVVLFYHIFVAVCKPLQSSS